MTIRRPTLIATLVVTLAIGGASCGGGQDVALPRALPTDFVPAMLPDPTDPANPLRLVEFEPARKRFARAGARSLVDAGALWEIRRGSNLVGTVEVGMLAANVDVTSEDDRRELITAVLPATSTTIRVNGIPVVRSASTDKVSYLVVGDGLFELVDVQISDKVDPERIINALIQEQLPTGWLKIAGEQRRRPL